MQVIPQSPQAPLPSPLAMLKEGGDGDDLGELYQVVVVMIRANFAKFYCSL